MGRILARAIITPDGTALQSFASHDYKQHTDANGEIYMIDGGPSTYGRTSLNEELPQYITITTDSPFEEIRKWFHWKSYVLSDGIEKAQRTPLKDLNEDHIRTLLSTPLQLSDDIAIIFRKELSFRLKEEITETLKINEVVAPKTTKNKV